MKKSATRAASENLDHLAFLFQLVELEMIDRERRAAERATQSRQVPLPKDALTNSTFSGFINQQAFVVRIDAGDYLDGRENICLYEGAGVEDAFWQPRWGRPHATKVIAYVSFASRS